MVKKSYNKIRPNKITRMSTLQEAAADYSQARLQASGIVQTYQTFRPKDPKAERRLQRRDDTKAALLEACREEGAKGGAFATAANRYLQAHDRAQECPHIMLRNVNGVQEAGKRMHELMDAQERLMEACGLPSALTPLERASQNAPKASNIKQ